jgi:hypothetical protein
MALLRSLAADGSRRGALSAFFRARRFRGFRQLASAMPSPVRVLDLGGTRSYWSHLGALGTGEFEITTVNIQGVESEEEGFRSLVGDVSNLEWLGESRFDMVHSNSVIEHLFTMDRQVQMAELIRSLGLPYWVQCPSYWTPMEPHFHVPGWQFLPKSLRYALIQRRACGMRGPARDPEHARRLVDEIRLLKRRELQALFPEARIRAEWIGPFQKSLIAICAGKP